MFKAFIADDENMVIKSLRASVDWKECGYEVIGEAYDGIEAYNKIISLKPDIVFTDIRMPGMNGLELIKRVGEANPNILFAVISGYAEFAYVQKALSYGALGFCLKPFDELEIVNVLKKARGVINRTRVSLEAELMTLMESDSYDISVKKKEILYNLGLECSGEKGILALVVSGGEELDILQDYKLAFLKMGKNKNAYLIQADKDGSIMEKVRENLPESIRCVGVSRVCYSYDTLYDTIIEASVASDQYFMTGAKGVYEYKEVNQNYLNNLLAQLENAIMKMDIPFIQDALDLIESAFIKGMYNIKNAFQVYSIIMHSFHVADPRKYEFCIYDYEELKSMFSDVKAMVVYLKKLISCCSLPKIDQISSDVTNETFKNILQYVNNNYFDDISLQSISQMFTVNLSYVSQLFKKQTGVTFTEYLTELRVNYAGNLLKSTFMPVNEIAEKAGFNDYYYFTRVFKKAMGITPTNFRAENCKNFR